MLAPMKTLPLLLICLLLAACDDGWGNGNRQPLPDDDDAGDDDAGDDDAGDDDAGDDDAGDDDAGDDDAGDDDAGDDDAGDDDAGDDDAGDDDAGDDDAGDDDAGDDDAGDDDAGDDDAGDDDAGDDDAGDDDAGDDDTAGPDLDGDGYVAVTAGGDDCDDTNPAVYPGQTENPGNSTDDDCDGTVDEGITILSLTPPWGISAGGSRVTVAGDGFNGVTAVTFGGVAGTSLTVVDDQTIEVTTPVGAAGDADVVVGHVLGTATRTDGWRWLGSSSAIDSAVLTGSQEPFPCATERYVPFNTPFTATVTEPGFTDTPGPNAAVLAEVGIGYQAWDPLDGPDGYTWTAATWSADDGGGHAYEGIVTPPTWGTWTVTFRFSVDGGYQWKYADFSGSTPADPIDMAFLDAAPSCP
jgi:hypothetical protein